MSLIKELIIILKFVGTYIHLYLVYAILNLTTCLF